MYNISVCKGCGRTIDGKFLYCPWCGFSKVTHEHEDSLDELLNRYKEKQKNTRRQYLYEMEQQLDELENELSVLVLSTEMHK